MCNNSTLSGFLSIVKKTVLMIQIIIPIILIVFAIFSFIKILHNPEEKNGINKIMNQFLAAIIIFLIPLLVDLVMNLVGEKTSLSSCWNSVSSKMSISKVYNSLTNNNRKSITSNANDYEKGLSGVSLNYNNSTKIPSEILKNASNSDPSIVIVDDGGNVLAQRKPHVLREGASTTKVFTGYAAVKLLDVENDKVVGSQYVTDYVGEFNNHSIAPGQAVTVLEAAARGFPDSSNTGAESIAVAIGYKMHNCTSDKEAHQKGIEEINKFIKSIGCEESNLRNGSGLGACWDTNNYVCKYGHTANDLAIVGIDAMQDENFLKSYISNTSSTYANLAKNINNNGLFFIKSGTGYFCHGIWGFNNKGKRYYIAMLGINCNQSSDDKYTVANDLYHWSINSLIK